MEGLGIFFILLALFLVVSYFLYKADQRYSTNQRLVDECVEFAIRAKSHKSCVDAKAELLLLLATKKLSDIQKTKCYHALSIVDDKQKRISLYVD